MLPVQFCNKLVYYYASDCLFVIKITIELQRTITNQSVQPHQIFFFNLNAYTPVEARSVVPLAPHQKFFYPSFKKNENLPLEASQSIFIL